MRHMYLVLMVMAVALCCAPAAAVILEESYMGTISKLDPHTNELNIKADYIYGIKAGEEGSWTTPAQPIISGTVDDPQVFERVSLGTPVQATILGGDGGSWMTIAFIDNPQSSDMPISWAWGDPDGVIPDYRDGYRITYTTSPDCATCEGTTCTASSADVAVLQNGNTVATHTFISPGEMWTHVSPGNDQYNLQITYLKGRALSSSCPGYGGMAGPQAISYFLVEVVQKGAATPVPATAELTEMPTPVPATGTFAWPTATQAPGFGTFAAGVGFLAAVALLRRR